MDNISLRLIRRFDEYELAYLSLQVYCWFIRSIRNEFGQKRETENV